MRKNAWAAVFLLATAAKLLAQGESVKIPYTPAAQVQNFDAQPFEKVSEKIERKYILGQGCMLVYWKLKKGALIPLHQHPNEQITYITEGKVEVIIDGKTVTIEKGGAVVISANTPHQFTALEDTIDLDIFTPIRSDWFDGSAEYLKPASGPVKK